MRRKRVDILFWIELVDVLRMYAAGLRQAAVIYSVGNDKDGDNATWHSVSSCIMNFVVFCDQQTWSLNAKPYLAFGITHAHPSHYVMKITRFCCVSRFDLREMS